MKLLVESRKSCPTAQTCERLEGRGLPIGCQLVSELFTQVKRASQTPLTNNEKNQLRWTFQNSKYSKCPYFDPLISLLGKKTS